jgi:uncharacterized membrane protein YphA (DoxX/SURF4 family)
MAARKKRASGKRKASPAGGGLWLPKFGLVSLRVFTGAIFLAAAWWKLIRPGLDLGETIRRFVEYDYVPMFEGAVRDPPVVLGWRMQWFADFVENVMLPGNAPYVFSGAFLVLEVLLGASLVLGACVRLMAALGALVMLFSGLAKRMFFLTIQGQGSNWLLMVMLVTLACTAAGRIWGLDSFVRRKFPGWIS